MGRTVGNNSRSATYSKKLVYSRKRWTTTAEKKASEPKKPQGIQRHYPTDDVRRRLKATGACKEDYKPTQKLKPGIAPGSVLILVAGRHRGKRVIFLKQLTSGLLLVTGPFKINGVPMRRVNQKFVLVTSTKLDLPKVNIPERVDDKYFVRLELNASDNNDKSEIFQTKKSVYTASSIRKEDQKIVDSAVIAAAKKVPYMVNYLGANFSLQNGQAPHELKF